MTRHFRILLQLFLAFTLCAVYARADISGIVSDPQGAPVAGATVHLLAGTYSRETTTDGAGRFRFSESTRGIYTLLATARGFSGTAERIEVQDGAATVELRLSLAARNEVVVVTAEPAEMPASAVASSTTVLTRAQLDEMHAENVAAALRHVPGLHLVQTGRRGGVAGVFARGGNSNFNLVMIDGVKVNDFGGAFNFANLPIESVERIEVVRGPQSALYGLNAIGSVIHIITRRPAGRLQARGAAEGGSFQTARGSLGAGGRSGPLAWNFDLMRDSTEGIVPNDDYRNETGSLHLDYAPGSAARLRYTFLVNANEVGSPGPYRFAPDGSPCANIDRCVDRVTRGKENSYLHGLQFEAQRGRFRQKFTGSVYSHRLGYESPFGPWNTRQLRGTAGSETSVSLAESDVLTFGFEYQRERIRNSFITDERFTDFPLFRNNFGWYAENRWERGGRLFLNTGLRLENIRTSAMPPDAFGGRPGSRARSTVTVNPKVSLAFLPRAGFGRAGGGTRLHASAGTGMRAPDAFELAFTNNPALEPERTTSFDAGVEHEFLGRRAVLDVTYFHNRYHDLIVTLGGGLSALSRYQSDNLANSRAQGVEVSGGLRPVEWLSLQGHYTWLKSEVLSLDRAPGRALAPLRVGQRLLRRPEHSAAYTVTWQIPRLRLALNAGAVMRSAVLDVHPQAGLSAGIPVNPGYVRPDAGAEFAIGRDVSLFARLYNFSDARYDEAYGFPALRRHFAAGLRFRWQ